MGEQDEQRPEQTRPEQTKPDRFADDLPHIAATTPTAAVKTFQLLDGFRMELVAAEPLVTDPVAMVFDEDGLAYVAEMGDYPYSDKKFDKPYELQESLPLGRIRILEDTDGDGRMDKSTIFADKLSWPTGLALWKGGVFVTATPEILYLKDTDGDRKADAIEKVFTGFRKYNVQAVINNLQWGLDNAIYGAGSSNGGVIQSLKHPDAKPVTLRRSDFRIDPLTLCFALQSGGARFGNTFDTRGNRFICNIRNPVQHIVLASRYLARNPYLPVRRGVVDAADSGQVQIKRTSPPEPWRVLNAQRVKADPTSKGRFDSRRATGYITSSSGITVYTGAAYPEEYLNNAFVGEVAGNVALCYKLKPEGVTFRAERSARETEFISSTDTWFRPVNFANAPDGTLYVLDMYRETIEHPWSMPDDIQDRLDLTSGKNRGRIWRLVPSRFANGYQKPPRPRLGTASTVELVRELANPNGWWRSTAQRLLYERQDNAAVPALRNMLIGNRQPVARLHAMWTLQGLHSLNQQDLLTALKADHAGVREQAVQIAEPLLNDSDKLQRQIIALADDSNLRVRFRVALALGELADGQGIPALLHILKRDPADRWIQTAVMSSMSNRSANLLQELITDQNFITTDEGLSLLSQIANVIAARKQLSEIISILQKIPATPAQADERLALRSALLTGFGSGLKRAGLDFTALHKQSDAKLLSKLEKYLNQSKTLAFDSKQSLSQRMSAIEQMSFGGYGFAHELLLELLDARQPREIQSAAIRALAAFRNPEVAEMLLEKYQAITPSVRVEIVNAMLGRSDRIAPLLEAVLKHKVSAQMIPWYRQLILMKSSNPEIKTRAELLFANEQPSPRQDVIEDYKQVFQLKYDLARGEQVFRKECLNCHKLGNQGHNVGPNLATIRHRTASEVMLHILDPNREVSPNFMQFIIVTNDGRINTGIIAAETATSITIRAAEGKEQSILRDDIETITSTGKSLMPEGLEKKIDHQQMADLLQFLLTTKKVK